MLFNNFNMLFDNRVSIVVITLIVTMMVCLSAFLMSLQGDAEVYADNWRIFEEKRQRYCPDRQIAGATASFLMGGGGSR